MKCPKCGMDEGDFGDTFGHTAGACRENLFKQVEILRAQRDDALKRANEAEHQLVSELHRQTCNCTKIQAQDPSRHFKGCPLRKDLEAEKQAAIDLDDVHVRCKRYREERNHYREIHMMHWRTLEAAREVIAAHRALENMEWRIDGMEICPPMS